MMKPKTSMKYLAGAMLLALGSVSYAGGGSPAGNTSKTTQSSAYAFNEFSWGANTNESVNVCASGSCLIEGDKFVTTPASAKDALTVVSYNVLRPSAQRITNQINWIKNKFGAQGPDVIFLSEVVRGSGCGAGRNTAREYAKAFNAYYVYGNEDGASSSCQTGNAIISRYPLGNVVVKRFNTQHGDMSGGATSTGRSFIAADINIGGNIVHAYSTHTASPFGISGDNARKAQHAEMVAHAQNKPFTRILGGDLNAIGHIFADPLGLHDISLNPFFDNDYKDAHDDMATHNRVTSEAGLIDNDWTLLLDFIFVQAGTTSNAGVCQSECRNKSTLSDHVPIWADVHYLKNGPAFDLNAMRSGGRYDMMIQTTFQSCGLQWQGGDVGSGERNAKFDCVSNPDPMTFEATSNPSTDSQGNVSIRGLIKTQAGGRTCGLEWDGSLSGGERNAKFDCSGSADPVIIKSLIGSNTSRIHITTVDLDGWSNDTCGLQWAGGDADSNGERNAKWDCDPAYDDMRMIGVLSSADQYRELRVNNSGKCLDFEGVNPTNGAKTIVYDCAGVAWQKWKYDSATGLLHNQQNPSYCLDHASNTGNGARPHMWQCASWSNNQKWDRIGSTFRPRNNHNAVLDAFGSSNGSAAGLWSSHGGSNQQWQWGSK